MSDINPKKPSEYTKHHSFNFFSSKKTGTIKTQVERALGLLNTYFAEFDRRLDCPRSEWHELLIKVRSDLLYSGEDHSPDFKITQFIAEEMETIEDADLTRYLAHRYRYDVFPLTKQLDQFPPYLQIEPSAICNFKCVFCYQTDPTYNSKNSGHLGTMTFSMYKEIVDQIAGKIEFISLASRGEPLVCRELPKMLEYSVGKFLGLKINTNASLLTEAYAHAILSGGIKTVVFSADAAEEPLYSQLRVNGSLEKTVRNIRLFQSIRSNYYSNLKIITRVSGVKVSEDQTMESMIKFWGDEVDQVAFVKYNPWENTYTAHPNDIITPCSDLWRRMFIWHDGKTNPCDSDYKSHLSVGNIQDTGVSALWTSPKYQLLRKMHLEGNRQKVEPCRRCFVI